jgi:hypothetical protein
MFVTPSPVLATFAFFGAFPFEFPVPFLPIPPPSSLFAFVPFVVIAIFGIIVVSFAAFLPPAVIIIVILPERGGGQCGAATQSADQFSSSD